MFVADSDLGTSKRAQDVWYSALPALENRMSRVTFDAYLRDAVPLAFDDDRVILGVNSELAKNWLQERHAPLVAACLSELVGNPVTVDFVVNSKEQPHAGVSAELDDEPPLQRQAAAAREAFPSMSLNPRYTFANFIVGKSNRFAHAIALSVAQNPSNSYNPFFLHGGVGLGKTHLMQAIGHHILAEHPEFTVVYISGENFVNHIVTAIREKRTSTFRSKYRNVDIWLVDDIQFIAAREGTRSEEEFFHTFNTLYETNKQIVVSSDVPPKDLQLLDDRLRSRFEWGVVADIGRPDRELRRAILEKRAEGEQVAIPSEVFDYIADLVQSNIRILEGALTKVIAYASLNNTQVTLEIAEEILRDYSTGERTEHASIENIQQVVSDYYHLNVEDIRGKRRNKLIALARQVAIYLAREMTDSSTPDIGAAFGGRDHSTVLHSYNKIREMIDSNPDFRNQIMELRARLRAP